MKVFKLILVVIVACFAMETNAQKPKPATAIKQIKFKTTIGGYKNNDSIYAVVADSVIGMKLTIRDDKNKVYEVSSYEFLYRKFVTSEDEATGKAYRTSHVRSQLFKATPLKKTWLDFVREDLKAGEELHFFAVIVKDGKGNVMYAPDLKLTVK
jgi:hypothetical protein